MATIISKDTLRASVEAATGGKCTVLYDAQGHPNYMEIFPKVNIEDLYPDLGMTGTFPSFIVNGEEKSEIFLGMYDGYLVDQNLVSLPGMDPANYLSFDEEVQYCANKGAGWHLMSNIEYALLQAYATKNGYQPRGNTNWGRHHDAKHEVGALTNINKKPGVSTGESHGRTRTGSGPASWHRDGTACSMADVVGNVWQRVAGLRIKDGEIQVFENNNAAIVGVSHADDSTQWKAVLPNGTLVAPGTDGTLKMDGSGADNETSGAQTVGVPRINTEVTNVTNADQVDVNFKDLAAVSGVNVPAILKLYGIFPVDNANLEGYMWVRTAGERIALRGG
ncbi:MAG: hypothetical protein IK079_06395, partial [Desulfovibrio sp.]|nr:hypothetical protein [Desulfovibrio sp.]